MVSRRNLLKMGARAAIAVAAIAAAPSTVLALSPREEAWRLLGVAKAFNDAGDKQKAIRTSATLFKHLMTYISDPKVQYASDEQYDRVVSEVRTCLKRPDEFDEATCTDAAFSILIVRTGLKYYKIPMVQAKNWKPFAKMYTAYVMAA